MIHFASSVIKEIIAPKLCCNCKTFFTFLCQNCYQQIDFSFESENKLLLEKLKSEVCYLDVILSVGSFSGPLQSLSTSLKYRGQIDVAKTIANLTYHTVAFPEIDSISCVPAHEQRIKEKGFNQSELIAKHLAFILNKPFKCLLVRNKKMRSQATIADKQMRKKRQQNTMKAIPTKSAQNKTVLLLDDVITTGATLNEAARVLKVELSATSVIGIAIARA